MDSVKKALSFFIVKKWRYIMDLRSKITLMALADITPYENNPRNNEEAVEKVANSIKEFGFNQPIVVDKDNVIIVGHTRYLAAQELGLSEAPVIVAENLSDEQARAYRLADNKTGELAGWDFEKLALELEQIESLDMGEFGFESHDLGGEIGDFFENAPTSNSNEHKPKIITCPHCGEEFEI
nr:MAG: ParB-like nuclease domain [Bacteriophage sp.]UWD67723.1 MAG: ParB-like nuclease domain [Bacteriophage sp.]UWI03344.1 MAG: ParB-like nuclease domain [Bacteriophage sp.]